MSVKEDEINREIVEIDERLNEIKQQIGLLEFERINLLNRKKECVQNLNKLLPSSIGGFKNDSTNSWNRHDFKWSENVNKCLKETFHLNSFRPLQAETINVTLSKQDCIVVMPTGGGKSLCFQLPAVIDDGITIVVSPLISLIEDQLWILRSLCINADNINGTTNKEKVKQIQTDMVDKKSDLKLIYVTPEKLAKSKMFMNKLEKMYEMGRFARLVVDEVHCCSTYGHDFRPDYKFLGVMKKLFPKVPILGLTATATDHVIEDLKKILNIQKCVLFKASFNRPNIYYEVRNKPSKHDEFMSQIATLIKNRFHQQSGIVYCFSQKESEQVAHELCSYGIRSDSYHANMDADERSKVHENWLKNKVHVIVATIAFGMGIDKSDCRFVIHHSLSKSLENFYQESGRAGRDGQPAWSVLYFRFSDVFRQSSLVFTEQTGLENLYTIVNYCINCSECKRNLIARHFSDDLWSKVGNCNKMCDYCDNKLDRILNSDKKNQNYINEALLVIELLVKQSEKSKEKKLTGNKLSEVVTSELNKQAKHGNFKSMDQMDVERLLLMMIMKKYLKEDFHFTPYSTICYIVPGPNVSVLYSIKEFFIDAKSIESIKLSTKPEESRIFHQSNDIICLDSDDDKETCVKRKKPVGIKYESDDDLFFEDNNIGSKSKKIK